jgi:hypothetical protein
MKEVAPGEDAPALVANIPVFAVRKKLFSKDFYVLATYLSGRSVKVARFHHRWDAQNWIDLKSQNWLVKRTADKAV